MSGLIILSRDADISHAIKDEHVIVSNVNCLHYTFNSFPPPGMVGWGAIFCNRPAFLQYL